MMIDTIEYKGNKYEFFKSQGGDTKFVDKRDYVAIDQMAYKVIKDLAEFKNITPTEDKETGIFNATGYIYLCEIDLSLNTKIKGIGHSIFLNDCYYASITNENKLVKLLDIVFYGVNFEKDCIITSSNFEEKPSLEFRQCHFEKKLKIRNTESIAIDVDVEKDYKEAQQNKLKLKKISIIDCTASNEAYLRIGFLDVKFFELSNLRLPQNAELNIGDCHFHDFKLTNFRNIGRFKLYKINILDKGLNQERISHSKFQIDNTSIGQTDFQSLNLNSFDHVVMFDNIFSNVYYTNVIWKQDIEVKQFQDDSKIEIAKKQDTYRNLKNIAQKNNDQPQALIFYAQEMRSHKKLTILNKNKRDNKRDIFTLRFNDWTNEFGLNWKRPLLWQLLPISIVAYLLLLLSMDIPILFLGHWGGYFEFLSPLHKTHFIGSYWNFLTYIIDFTFRIIEGLLIYQTIQAFRKYSRKL